MYVALVIIALVVFGAVVSGIGWLMWQLVHHTLAESRILWNKLNDRDKQLQQLLQHVVNQDWSEYQSMTNQRRLGDVQIMAGLQQLLNPAGAPAAPDVEVPDLSQVGGSEPRPTPTRIPPPGQPSTEDVSDLRELQALRNMSPETLRALLEQAPWLRTAIEDAESLQSSQEDLG